MSFLSLHSQFQTRRRVIPQKWYNILYILTFCNRLGWLIQKTSTLECSVLWWGRMDSRLLLYCVSETWRMVQSKLHRVGQDATKNREIWTKQSQSFRWCCGVESTFAVVLAYYRPGIATYCFFPKADCCAGPSSERKKICMHLRPEKSILDRLPSRS